MTVQYDLFGRVSRVPETEGIKYTGSKLKILPTRTLKAKRDWESTKKLSRPLQKKTLSKTR